MIIVTIALFIALMLLVNSIWPAGRSLHSRPGPYHRQPWEPKPPLEFGDRVVIVALPLFVLVEIVYWGWFS